MTISSKLFLFGMAWAALAGWVTAKAGAPTREPAAIHGALFLHP
jgi:hypothetical protein